MSIVSSAPSLSTSAGPAWAQAMRRFSEYLSQDFLGGPRPWKFAWVINFQKTGTFLFLGLLMWVYQNNSPTVWVYLALHGSYGLVWFLKDMAFPDPNWQKRITIGGGINAFSRYENGKTKPPLALVKLLKVLERHPDLLNEIRAS